MKLFEKIEKSLDDTGILPALEDCGTILCALSGGADSVVLLHFLHWYLPGMKRFAVVYAQSCRFPFTAVAWIFPPWQKKRD